MTVTASRPTTPARFTEADCRLDDFVALIDQETVLADYPHAVDVVQNVLVYDASALREPGVDREALQAELVRAFTEGPGVAAFRQAFPDHAVVDRATAAFERIIAAERSAGGGHNDHFGSGVNDRVWSALEKLAVTDPETFVDYYGNDLLALVSSAWLGPAYQVTSQINVVRPGGKAQDPHRDYHLGFLSNETAARYPAHVHLLSPVLTLQGAVAHSDMPVESGPTMYLPYSHQYAPGYLAWRLPAFREHFQSSHVQLALEKGDAAFFNPALFHGAGNNVSADVQRMANLLQVSSAFGRAMETVDRSKIVRAVYPVLRARQRAGSGADAASIANAVAASAEGYPFPTNLDLDENVGGLTPLSQAELVTQALADDLEPEALAESLTTYDRRHRTDEI
ncbi:MAG: phytanoyl-CoA dioxygenase family protein [Janthinobacterium lividum]